MDATTPTPTTIASPPLPPSAAGAAAEPPVNDATRAAAHDLLMLSGLANKKDGSKRTPEEVAAAVAAAKAAAAAAAANAPSHNNTNNNNNTSTATATPTSTTTTTTLTDGTVAQTPASQTQGTGAGLPTASTPSHNLTTTTANTTTTTTTTSTVTPTPAVGAAPTSVPPPTVAVGGLPTPTSAPATTITTTTNTQGGAVSGGSVPTPTPATAPTGASMSNPVTNATLPSVPPLIKPVGEEESATAATPSGGVVVNTQAQPLNGKLIFFCGSFLVHRDVRMQAVAAAGGGSRVGGNFKGEGPGFADDTIFVVGRGYESTKAYQEGIKARGGTAKPERWLYEKLIEADPAGSTVFKNALPSAVTVDAQGNFVFPATHAIAGKRFVFCGYFQVSKPIRTNAIKAAGGKVRSNITQREVSMGGLIFVVARNFVPNKSYQRGVINCGAETKPEAWLYEHLIHALPPEDATVFIDALPLAATTVEVGEAPPELAKEAYADPSQPPPSQRKGRKRARKGDSKNPEGDAPNAKKQKTAESDASHGSASVTVVPDYAASNLFAGGGDGQGGGGGGDVALTVISSSTAGGSGAPVTAGVNPAAAAAAAAAARPLATTVTTTTTTSTSSSSNNPNPLPIQQQTGVTHPAAPAAALPTFKVTTSSPVRGNTQPPTTTVPVATLAPPPTNLDPKASMQ